MLITCLRCYKVIGETIGNGGYLAKRGGFRMDEEGNVFQMCRHCGEEFLVEVIPNGVKLQWKNGIKVAE